ncbi:MAG: hypothetical protein NZ455_03680 [Bacteroidia bacterium]|nr:hypothetical protein [Bacteroidia bacterium]MDW8347482.1 hypothetical protein [Bacteroidia bacterium]
MNQIQSIFLDIKSRTKFLFFGRALACVSLRSCKQGRRATG